jgi:DNA-binding winged helix-turn-helix (wHTH) protein/WD40 repeat protein
VAVSGLVSPSCPGFSDMKTTAPRTALFGPYELDLRSGELRKFGTKVKMGEQAFQILRMLLDTPGQLVTREELRSKLWADDTFVDFDHGLNSAVQRLRDCLSDSAGKPQWVETIPRRGYRFVGQVEWLDEGLLTERISQTIGEGPDQDAANGTPVAATLERAHVRRKLLWGTALIAVTLLVAIAVARLANPGIPEPKALRFRKLANIQTSKGCPYSAGSLVYFIQEDDSGSTNQLMQLSTTGGDPLPMPNPLRGALSIQDISKDGSKLLVTTRNGRMQRDLWIVPVPSGSPRRISGVTAQDAAFSSDGSRIAYANGNSLFESKADGSEVRKIVTTSGFLDSPVWSPDDKRLRYRQTPAFSHHGTYWEVSDDGKPHPLFSGIGGLCCGGWTSDGKYFVYFSRREGEEGFWAVREKRGWLRAGSEKPVLMAASTLASVCGAPSRAGNQIFLIGEQPQAEVIRYDAPSKQFLPFLGGQAAEYLSFSRDGQWVAYATYPEGELWRSKVDGSEKLKLTEGVRALKIEWSPDGKLISFVAKQPTIALYVIPADGGTPQRLPTGDTQVLGHSWSPDGNSMVIGEWVGTSAPVLRMLDLKKKQLSVVPGSGGIIEPFWSPDGGYITGFAPEGPRQGGWLYEVAARRWTQLPLARPRAWSRDGRHIYYQSAFEGEAAVTRFRMADGKIEKVASLKGIRGVDGSLGEWFGLDPSDAPLLLRNTGNEQIYALDWDAP